jgi:hypothetical protein
MAVSIHALRARQRVVEDVPNKHCVRVRED